MALQKNFVNGPAVPRRTGRPTEDLNAVYTYLYKVMEQLGHIVEFLELQGNRQGRSIEDCEQAGKSLGEGMKSLKAAVEGLRYAASETVGGAASRTAAIPMGKVDGTSTSTAFTATVPGIRSLYNGVLLWLTNGAVTSAAGFTVNINGLGAKPCYGSMAAATQSSTIFNINYTMLLIYNESRVAGGCWDIVYGYDSNTNTIGYQLRTNSTSLPMADKTYRYRLLFTSTDGMKWVPATTSTSTNATAARAVNQRPINPHGRIVYYGTTAAVDAGANPSTSYLWSQYVATLGYSFNRTGAALVLTYPAPVWLKAAPQADGSAILDDTTPYVQALPSAEDGKIYIYLGTAVSATTVEIVPEHPIYQYKDGAVRLWVGP